mgnify:CR=1 FL=1
MYNFWQGDFSSSRRYCRAEIWGDMGGDTWPLTALAQPATVDTKMYYMCWLKLRQQHILPTPQPWEIRRLNAVHPQNNQQVSCDIDSGCFWDHPSQSESLNVRNVIEEYACIQYSAPQLLQNLCPSKGLRIWFYHRRIKAYQQSFLAVAKVFCVFEFELHNIFHNWWITQAKYIHGIPTQINWTTNSCSEPEQLHKQCGY